MNEYFKKFTIDKDGITVIDFGENEVFECKYSDEAKSLCNRLNDLDYEKYNLKKENEQLYELLDFANTLFAFKTSESCQKEWEKKLNELIVND